MAKLNSPAAAIRSPWRSSARRRDSMRNRPRIDARIIPESLSENRESQHHKAGVNQYSFHIHSGLGSDTRRRGRHCRPVERFCMTAPNAQHEPTMEEILASIRKIISEDPPGGEGTADATAATPSNPDEPEVLDLTQEVHAESATIASEPTPPVQEPSAESFAAASAVHFPPGGRCQSHVTHFETIDCRNMLATKPQRRSITKKKRGITC